MGLSRRQAQALGEGVSGAANVFGNYYLDKAKEQDRQARVEEERKYNEQQQIKDEERQKAAEEEKKKTAGAAMAINYAAFDPKFKTVQERKDYINKHVVPLIGNKDYRKTFSQEVDYAFLSGFEDEMNQLPEGTTMQEELPAERLGSASIMQGAANVGTQPEYQMTPGGAYQQAPQSPMPSDSMAMLQQRGGGIPGGQMQPQQQPVGQQLKPYLAQNIGELTKKSYEASMATQEDEAATQRQIEKEKTMALWKKAQGIGDGSGGGLTTAGAAREWRYFRNGVNKIRTDKKNEVDNILKEMNKAFDTPDRLQRLKDKAKTSGESRSFIKEALGIGDDDDKNAENIATLAGSIKSLNDYYKKYGLQVVPDETGKRWITRETPDFMIKKVSPLRETFDPTDPPEPEEIFMDSSEEEQPSKPAGGISAKPQGNYYDTETGMVYDANLGKFRQPNSREQALYHNAIKQREKNLHGYN